MPLEIRELIIKAEVKEGKPSDGMSPSSGMDINREELISDCVERVMDLIKLKQER